MKAGLLALAGLIALAGCAKPPVSQRQAARLYAADFQGKAKTCTATAPAEPGEGARVEGRMTLVNDGGWCDIALNRPGPRPFDAGLLVARPAHGQVTIHTVGDQTRVDYAPDAGFSGTDAFSVRLLPGNAEMKVAVSVQPGAPAATPASAPPPPPPAAPASRTRRR